MSRNPTQALTRQALDTAGDLSERAVQAAHGGIDTLRTHATHVGDQTVGYIRQEPVKAVVTAAAVGAIAALLLGWLGRSRGAY